MNPNRLEPTKEENEQGIARMRKELRGELPLKFDNARCGLERGWIDYADGVSTDVSFKVVANVDGQTVTIAEFPFDSCDKRRESARILAEELADRLNGV